MAKSTKSTEAAVIKTSINSRVVEKGKKYLIRERITPQTPDIYAANGRGKSVAVETPDISYLRVNKYNGNYDLGLDSTSMDFNSSSDAEIKAILSQRKDVLEACKSLFGKEFLSNSTEANEAMNNFTLQFKHDRRIDTSDREGLIEVHAMLLTNKIAFKDEFTNPKYKDARYVIECVEDVKSIEEQENAEIAELLDWFANLKHTNRSLLVSIMGSIRASINENVNDGVLAKAFNQMLSDRRTRTSLLRYATDEDAVATLKDEVIARKLIKNGVLVKEGAQYKYKGMPIGSDDKAVAHKLRLKENKALYEELRAMLDEE